MIDYQATLRAAKLHIGITMAALMITSTVLAAADAPQLKRDELAWREQRAAGLLKPDGWFSLVALDWLRPGKTTVGAAADNVIKLTGNAAAHVAILDLESNQVRILPPPEGFPAGLTIGGKPAQTGPVSEDIPIKIGTFTLVAIQRGDRFALRIKDSQAPTRLQFHGLNWYAPEEKYRVKARWTPYTPPRDISIATIIGGIDKDKVPGVAEFTFDGKIFHLEPIVENDKLFFILRDATSHSTTYDAGRFLYTSFPSNGLDKPGELWLDFNRLQNPPCAYTPYATCPLPPRQNRLEVAIPAGEKRYHEE